MRQKYDCQIERRIYNNTELINLCRINHLDFKNSFINSRIRWLTSFNAITKINKTFASSLLTRILLVCIESQEPLVCGRNSEHEH